MSSFNFVCYSSLIARFTPISCLGQENLLKPLYGTYITSAIHSEGCSDIHFRHIGLPIHMYSDIIPVISWIAG